MSGRPRLQDLITPDMSDEESAAVARAVIDILLEHCPPPPTREEVAAEIRKRHRARAIRCARMFSDGRPWVSVEVYGPVTLLGDGQAPEPMPALRCDFPIGYAIRRDPRRAKRIWNENLDSMTEFDMQHHSRWRLARN